MQRATADLLGSSPPARATQRPVAGPRRLAARTSFRLHGASPSAVPAKRQAAGRLRLRSASKATASTRSRSARCTPASSSRGTSAFRSSARRCCASRSGSATRTRASRSASPSSLPLEAPSPRRARLGRHRRSPTRGPTAWRSNQRPGSHGAGARALAARAAAGARAASPTTSATSVRSATTPRLAFGLAQFSRLREDWLRMSNRRSFGHRLLMDARRAGRRGRRCRRREQRTGCAPQASASRARSPELRDDL
mgnify:CR=1 FL=1